MDLKDVVINVFNTYSKRSNVNMSLKELLIFRPVVKEPPFEHMEVIHDVRRLLFCDPVCIVFLVKYYDRRLEYEAKFKNDDGELSLTSYRLRYCEYSPKEEPKKIEEDMKEKIKMVLTIILAIFKGLSFP